MYRLHCHKCQAPVGEETYFICENCGTDVSARSGDVERWGSIRVEQISWAVRGAMAVWLFVFLTYGGLALSVLCGIITFISIFVAMNKYRK